MKPKSGQEFLRAHVNHTGNDCVIWPLSKTGGRGIRVYGKLKIGGVQKLAHRCMCAMAHGEPPTPKHEAAHSCHNPSCVNPRHLRWATRLENETDKDARGTRPRGENHTQSRLTEDEVRAIRVDSRKQRAIAKDYGVAQSQICGIKSGNTWKHM